MNQIAVSSLSALVHALDDAVLAPPGLRAAAAAEALRPFLDRADLLQDHACPCSAERYARHALHVDPHGRYCLVAIVWRPGQESPIHAHKTWCAFGIHRGALVESFFAVPDAEHPEFRDAVVRRCGAISCGEADPCAAHRVTNTGVATAVSLHVYGVAFDDYGTGVSAVLAA
jgi:predicted metal-dependent enzyme (double-stranded beta helix superfamily)